MEERELEAFLKKLVARRQVLVDEGRFEIEPARKDASGTLDEDEQPYTEMSQVIASRRNKNRALELQRIESAIARIREDPEDFGFCEGCDEPIPIKRLELMPWARFCVKCQSAHDGDERGYRRSHAADYLD